MAAKAITVVRLGLSEYQKTWDLQKTFFEQRLRRQTGDRLLLCEHPHTYTIGRDGLTAASNHLLLTPKQMEERGIALYEIDRGGDITYHGPGQLVGYPVLDLNMYYRDVHRYLRDLEEVIIRTLSDTGITARRFAPHTGVWADTLRGPKKICAIGVKVSRWITMHGFALNVCTDLNFFSGIIPCGIQDYGVTSVSKLTGKRYRMSEIENLLVHRFGEIFNAVMNDDVDHLMEDEL